MTTLSWWTGKPWLQLPPEPVVEARIAKEQAAESAGQRPAWSQADEDLMTKGHETNWRAGRRQFFNKV